MIRQKIILNFKKHALVRILAFPFVNILRFFRRYTYRFSKDAKKIKALRGIHSGKRCFIIGNGPSLTSDDLNKLKNEYCFAANKIYHIFDKTCWRPEFYLCVDSFVYHDIKEVISSLDLNYIFVHLEGKKYKIANKHLTYINNYYPFLVNQYKRSKNIKFSTDVSKYFIAGETVTYNSIQLAAYMGFKEIYLLGVDHNYSQKIDSNGKLIINSNIKDYFGDLKTSDYSVQQYGTSTAAYRSAKEYCTKNNITIKNATRGGVLEVFDRCDLDDILKGLEKHERKNSGYYAY